MNPEAQLEASRSEAELCAAYAREMAKQVASGPHDLAVLRDRFRRRRREIRRGAGTGIDSRADWIVACVESSLPDAVLEAELLRLAADDPRLDVDRLRQVLAAREEWQAARYDPRIPSVVLHVLLSRLGVPARARAVAEDVAHPREVAECVAETYPALRALDPAMFEQIAGVPRPTHGARRRSAQASTSRRPKEKGGWGGFWAAVFVIYLVTKLIGSLGKSPEPLPQVDTTPLKLRYESALGDEYMRISRRMERVEALRLAVRAAQAEHRRTGSIKGSTHFSIRELLRKVPAAAHELRESKRSVDTDAYFPRATELRALDSECSAAHTRMTRERMKALVDWQKAETERRAGAAKGGG